MENCVSWSAMLVFSYQICEKQLRKYKFIIINLKTKKRKENK